MNEGGLNVLVTDDDPSFRQHLVGLISGRPEVGNVMEASDGREALEAMNEQECDLAFLDVKLPDVSGLDIVEEFGRESMPVMIFVTAYEEYAVRAFDTAAIDYLLKPLDEERLKRAYERALEAVKLKRIEHLATEFEGLLGAAGRSKDAVDTTHSAEPSTNGEAHGHPAGDYLERVTVESKSQIHVVPVDEIRYVTAENMYVKIHTSDDSYLLRSRLYEMEQSLNPAEFARIHRSTIVRMECVDRLVRRSEADYMVQLDGGETFRVGRSRRDDLMRQLQTGSRA